MCTDVEVMIIKLYLLNNYFDYSYWIKSPEIY